MSEVTNIAGSKNTFVAGQLRSLYFIGIGGIGMSAIARYYHSKGASVSGYDKTPTELTRELEAEGINIHYSEDISLIPKDIELVVYTPAVPANHAELVYYRDNGYKVVKRSDVLKLITESSFNIGVAGTHGKTTVSTMIAHILRHTGFGCNAFLGGISADYDTNFWSSENNVCVVEADEYDRSFLKLYPDVAVITAMDPDHLDIYGTPEEVEKAFVAFSNNVKNDGLVVAKYGLSRYSELAKAGAENQEQETRKKCSYSFNNTSADVYAADVKVENGSYVFDIVSKGWKLNNVTLHMGGLHNIENVVAAASVAKHLGIDEDKIKHAIEQFKGVKRRFEYALRSYSHILIDDYAHHPEELKALITGVRSLFSQKLVIIFQPHLYTRTNDQADGFAEVLDTCDEVILLPIYPARELPVEGVESEMIAERMQSKSVKVMGKDEMLEWVKSTKPELLVMAGAGDIDVLVNHVKQLLESE